ncbi:MAG: type II toxin-antitoxin system VapC family toxin [Pseudomonadota bacterium]|nr:type II toxin-antitoxin system VapC family toxin [Pseudomonadota bacterium]
MKCLLDTHAFLWALISPEKLSESARAAMTSANNPVFVSAISFWEIALKHRLGKLSLHGIAPAALPDAALRQGFDLLPLDARLAAGFSALPDIPDHRDPFARMLIWQAVSLGHTLVRCDRKIETDALPGLRVLW